ncbi:MAG: MFS transporter [Chloroflexi bacterium]|nr:MFS transporter [Chloroflexota bacterium]
MSSSMDHVIEDQEGEQLKSTQPRAIEKREGGGLFSPLRVRNFQLLFAGQTISTLGDNFYAVALPWLVLTTGGNPQELGIILMGYGLPRLGAILLGGVLSDKIRPRWVMLIADAVRAVLVAILAALGIMGHPAFWQLLAVAIPLGAFGGLFIPASFTMIPDILDDADLQAGNSLNFSSTQLATLVGSGIAGTVVSMAGSGIALAIDAGSFIVSAVSLAAMRTKNVAIAVTANAASTTGQAETTGVSRGENASEPVAGFWQIIRSSALVQVALVIVVVANLTLGGMVEVALPALARGPLNAGAAGFGFLLSCFGAGAFIGSIVTGLLGKLTHRGAISLLVAIAQAGAIALIPYAGGLIGALVCMFIMGFTNSITNVLFITLIQQTLPRAQLGRMMSVIMFAALGSYPISVLFTGILVTRTGPAIMFPISAAFLAVGALFGLSRREIREL